MTVFLSGGCKNGKTSLAQTLAVRLADGGPLWYAAAMIPRDDEDVSRIRAHVENRRGLGFTTLEAGRGISPLVKQTGGRGAYLLDSVTALLANEMFPETGRLDLSAAERVRADLLGFLSAAEHAVLVSDWIYGGAGPYGEWTEHYLSGLALLDRTLAEHCDAVAEVTAGIPYWHKGAERVSRILTCGRNAETVSGIPCRDEGQETVSGIPCRYKGAEQQ